LNDPEQNYISIDLTSTEENLESSLKLYPNPTNGFVTIELEAMQKVMVYNALGQVLLSKEANGDALQLDLSGLGNGLFWVKVMTQNGTVVRPLVISK
jgi:hypothetical protein